MSNEITPNDFSEIRWRGHWIWVDPPPQGRSRSARARTAKASGRKRASFFRKTFSLDQVPARVPGAHHRRLALSAVRQRAGSLSRPDPQPAAALDLRPARPGALSEARREHDRRLRGLLRQARAPSGCRPLSSGALGGSGVLVFEADLGPLAQDGWLVSDASWKTLKSDAWSEDWKNPAEMHPLFGDAIPTEVVDARRLPFGWEQPGFDDSAWGTSHLIPAVGHPGSGGRTQPPTDPYGPLHPRPIGKLGGDLRTPTAVRAEYLAGQVDAIERRPGQAAAEDARPGREPAAAGRPAAPGARRAGGRLRPHHAGHGRHRHGAGAVRGARPRPARCSTSRTREDPLAPPRGPFDGMHSGTRYVARGANDRFKLYDALGFRYAYILVHGVTGPVTLQQLRRAGRRLPLAARRRVRVQR